MKNEWKKTDLCGEWKLCLIKNSDCRARGRLPLTLQELEKQEWIPAQVPGNPEIDLQRAGLLEDPFYGQNVLKTQKLEALHLFYGRRFSYTATENTTPLLSFEGLDTVAEIWLNGRKVGSSDNMFIPHTFVLDSVKEGENELVVHITPACIAARERETSAMHFALKYNYEALRLRKSASMFGWDIMPRIVSGGMYRPVYIADRPKEYFRQVYLMTQSISLQERRAGLTLFYETEILGDEISEYWISLRGECGESSFEKRERLWFSAGKLSVELENAKFWWPRGYGRQPLYNVEVVLGRGERVIDRQTLRLGIRQVRLERTAVTDADMNGRFRFYVNDRGIFILGTNLVPVDALHSRDRQRLPGVMALLEEIGCNALRIWGGGVYEDDFVYDFCDEKGILIWQDFMMACGSYPGDEDFCRVMEEEAKTIVRRLRQHPSLLLWAGDNECDMSCFRKDPSGNRITREVLPRIVAYEDPERPYLPSSPFREAEHISEEYLPENHLWGPRDYYRSDYYKKSLCSFASEIGYHGCPSRKSLEKFLPGERLWPWQDNQDWIVHGTNMETGNEGSYSYRIGLMANQVKTLFGEIPDNLDDFILASQISQAEALKFFLELFRTGQPKRTGIIWWNLIDGWPQFSDAVVDYYFEKKLAYEYIHRAQQPLIGVIREQKEGSLELIFVNDGEEETDVRYSVKEWRTERMIWEGRTVVTAGVNHLARISCDPEAGKLYLLQWEQDGVRAQSHYLAGKPPFSLQEYREFLVSVYG